ncbi:MAG: hypothetical protein MJZ08_09580, partial [Bacteroidaceae bacterium]|nr:hypothetical protein [Bacteroidaceae bacterium]
MNFSAKLVKIVERSTFFEKKNKKKFGVSKKSITFASAFREMPSFMKHNCGNSSVGRAQPCQGWGR